MVYYTKGVCATEIRFDVEKGLVRNVAFTKGCDGNLKAIGILVEGMKVEEVIKKLKGIRCGNNSTSCGDQFAKALEEYLKEHSSKSA